MIFDLPVDYTKLSGKHRKLVREQYIKEQDGSCAYCNESLDGKPPTEITDLKINWKLFPPFFWKSPVHLQHDHDTNMTEGAVHYYCNAVMWQYYGR